MHPCMEITLNSSSDMDNTIVSRYHLVPLSQNWTIINTLNVFAVLRLIKLQITDEEKSGTNRNKLYETKNERLTGHLCNMIALNP